MQRCTNGQGPRLRSFDCGWDDAVLGEIELGYDAYVAMACDWDLGLNRMLIWRMFEVDALTEEGELIPTVGPWGPWGDGYGELTDEELEEDEERARRQSQWDEDRHLERALRRRP